MKAAAAALALALCACASPPRPRAAPVAEPSGAPRPAPAASPAAAGPDAPELPDMITLPAAYRLMLVDGRLALVRETGARAGGVPLRVLAADEAQRDPTFAPAPLPQELAAQLAESRESAARMDGALESVMQRSRELSDRALELEAQGRRLAELLAASEARVRRLEAAGGRAPPQADPAAQGSGP